MGSTLRSTVIAKNGDGYSLTAMSDITDVVPFTAM
jgi:hypothetical protein